MTPSWKLSITLQGAFLRIVFWHCFIHGITTFDEENKVSLKYIEECNNDRLVIICKGIILEPFPYEDRFSLTVS